MSHPSPFKWRHFEAEIILLCVRWYVRYPLSYRDLEEMMAERGLRVDHTTISRWVQHYAPELDRRCRPHLKSTTDSWRVTVLASIVASVTEIRKRDVTQVGEDREHPTLYTLEEQTHAALLRIGQVIVQGLVAGQGRGLVGPIRPCGCGAQQTYHDQAHPLQGLTSLGKVCLEQRAWYQCACCGATSHPLDEQLGLAPVGRMSRYLQEQCGWLLAVLPIRLAQQALVRFGWPGVAASQVRERGEALGAELDMYLQERLAGAQHEASKPPATLPPPRQPPSAERLYAAPDGVMYCTTKRDEETGKVRWRELKVAAVYEATPAKAGPEPAQEDAPVQLPVRTRITHWLSEQAPELPVAPPDQAVRVTYVAETGPWERLGSRLWGELWERGLGRPAHDLAVVADGSDHIDQVVDNALRVPGIHLTRIFPRDAQRDYNKAAILPEGA